jgi:hypothetical protein
VYEARAIQEAAVTQILTPGFGSCCCCEGDIAHNPGLIMLEFEGPPGFKGWGCAVCHLPTRGAIAVICQACVRAQRLPIFIAAGRNVADNTRVRLDDKFPQVPFKHRLELHSELWPAPGQRSN